MTPLRPYLWGGGATLVLFASVVVVLFLFAAGLADKNLPGSASTIAPQRPSSIQIADRDHAGRDRAAKHARARAEPRSRTSVAQVAPAPAQRPASTSHHPSGRRPGDAGDRGGARSSAGPKARPGTASGDGGVSPPPNTGGLPAQVPTKR